MPYPEHVVGQVNLGDKLKPPSTANWFGTDEVGNDILTRIIVGARLSLLVGVGITFAAAAIGVPLGILAGTAGGRSRRSCASPISSCRCRGWCWRSRWWPRSAPASATPWWR